MEFRLIYVRKRYNEACHLARLMRRKGDWHTEYQEWWAEFPKWLQDHAAGIASMNDGTTLSRSVENHK